jgi:RNA polymerase sigma-B factor
LIFNNIIQGGVVVMPIKKTTLPVVDVETSSDKRADGEIAGEKSSNNFCKEENMKLFKEYAAAKDTAIREKLILLQGNLVRFLAGKYLNRGVPLDDLVQVGTIGLIHAIDRFNPELGFEFSTYATPTIVGEIRRHFRDKVWMVNVPRRLQELSRAVRKIEEKLSQELGRTPSFREIANKIGAEEVEVRDAIEARNCYVVISLDQEVDNDNGVPITLSWSFWAI